MIQSSVPADRTTCAMAVGFGDGRLNAYLMVLANVLRGVPQLGVISTIEEHRNKARHGAMRM
jgi:hypothetical protein